jgi:hypothetical protein
MIRRMTSPPTLPPLVARLGRVGLGAVVVLAVNALVIAVAVPVGLYLDRLFEALAVGEGVLLVTCVVAAVTLAVRRRRGLGMGLFVGWAAGYLGLLALVVAFFVAVIVVAIGLLVAWVLVWVVGGLIAGGLG